MCTPVPFRKTTMRSISAPSDLPPDECRDEISGLLAIGVLRLRKRYMRTGALSELPPETAPESASDPLELAGKTVLSVHTG